MSNHLKYFFDQISMAQNEHILRCLFMDEVNQYFQIEKWGISLWNEHDQIISIDTHGVSSVFIENYQQIGRFIDPVLSYVNKYHFPAHEELVMPQGTWKQSELYQKCCIMHKHEHIMTGGIVNKGKLIGVINFARVNYKKSFNYDDLAKLSAVCLHISVRLAQLRENSFTYDISVLTPREMEIVNLVKKGLRNKEISRELWITENSVKQALKRIFRKLGANNRTQMVDKLSKIVD